MTIYDRLCSYEDTIRAQHVGPEILDMVAHVAGLMKVCEYLRNRRVGLFVLLTDNILLQDRERLNALLNDAKKLGFDLSNTMKVSIATCCAAEGETDEAIKVLNRYCTPVLITLICTCWLQCC